MKFYIAARFGLKNEVRKMYALLKERGYEIFYDDPRPQRKLCVDRRRVLGARDRIPDP